MNVAGLFAGVGGFETGLTSAGHHTKLLVEIDKGANRVLDARFPGIERAFDIRDLDSLSSSVDLVAAGFPCQDLSQAGQTTGIRGSRSGLVDEVFRLAKASRTPWIVLENVPFMLRLNRGEAIRHVVGELERLGYAWAYRTVDTRAFGLPQRRERVFLLASLVEDPARLLFQHQAAPSISADHRGLACGFYWTEGTRGLGWAVDAIPTLKGGSTIGIPSAPAIWMPDGLLGTPDIRDAERLQGFEADWTKPADAAVRHGHRWKLVGNAVSIPVAAWIGSILNLPPADLPRQTRPLPADRSWPPAAMGRDTVRTQVDCSTWPVPGPPTSLEKFLEFDLKPLSRKAALGFYRRLTAGSLRHPPQFRMALERHLGIGANC
jgi:DNA (cytosine-5)-methyltransferase 1